MTLWDVYDIVRQMCQPSKENIHSIMACPGLDPWATHDFFTPEGKLESRELNLTPIRLKKGTANQFIERFREVAAKDQPFFLEFYSPAGLLMQAEVRRIEFPKEQTKDYDMLNFLVYLTPDQVLAFSPIDTETEFGY